MDEIIQRIQEKVAAKKSEGNSLHWLEGCLSLNEIETFEGKFGVRLPEEYRRFLLEVGSTKADRLSLVYGLKKVKAHPGNPPYYYSGMISETYPATHFEYYVKRHLQALHLPFPFTDIWMWEGVGWDEKELEKKTQPLCNGNLFLSDEGCGMTWHLIVTGPERGHVWQFTGEGITPTVPKRDFLTWFEDSLEDNPNWWGLD